MIGTDFATGFGLQLTLANFTNSPAKLAPSLAHNARMAATYSSARLPRRSKGMPNASNSSFSQPTPMAEMVERGDLLGQNQRVALWQDHHSRHEAQPRGGGVSRRSWQQQARADTCSS